MSYLSILEITSLSVASFADIFSNPLGGFICYFAVQKLLSLLRFYSFQFYFSRIQIQKYIAVIFCQTVLPMFSSRNFMVSSLKFTYLIHFEFIFVNVVRIHSTFFLLHVVVQFSQCYLLKRLSFLPCLLLSPFLQIKLS